LDTLAVYQAVAHSIRDRLIHSWNWSQQSHTLADPKRVYYLSMEFLVGRSLDNAMLNLNVKDCFKEAARSLGFNLEEIIEEEVDAALGNGGLGRLGACILDSLASLNYPAWVSVM
jgi:starch phosphorylase